MFQSGDRHPKAVPLSEVAKILARLPLGTRVILPGTLRRNDRSYRVVDARCTVCGIVKTYSVDSLIRRTSRNCACQRNRKYFDDRSETLGRRYDAMIQRCYRDTHVSSHRYKGRGIQVRFRSREAFIRWALKKYPNTDFKGLDFDRIDNDGDYSQRNLRLVSRRVNLQNR